MPNPFRLTATRRLLQTGFDLHGRDGGPHLRRLPKTPTPIANSNDNASSNANSNSSNSNNSPNNNGVANKNGSVDNLNINVNNSNDNDVFDPKPKPDTITFEEIVRTGDFVPDVNGTATGAVFSDLAARLSTPVGASRSGPAIRADPAMAGCMSGFPQRPAWAGRSKQ